MEQPSIHQLEEIDEDYVAHLDHSEVEDRIDPSISHCSDLDEFQESLAGHHEVRDFQAVRQESG